MIAWLVGVAWAGWIGGEREGIQVFVPETLVEAGGGTWQRPGSDLDFRFDNRGGGYAPLGQFEDPRHVLYGVKGMKVLGKPTCGVTEGVYTCVGYITGRTEDEGRKTWLLIVGGPENAEQFAKILVEGGPDDHLPFASEIAAMKTGFRWNEAAIVAAEEAAARRALIDPRTGRSRKEPGPCTATRVEDRGGHRFETQMTWTWAGEREAGLLEEWHNTAGQPVRLEQRHEYDATGRRTRTTIIRSDFTRVVTYTYDAAGTQTGTADDGNRWIEEYDSRGRVTRTTHIDPQGKESSFTYEYEGAGEGRLLRMGGWTVIWSGGASEGTTERRTSADGDIDVYEHDRYGNLVSNDGVSKEGGVVVATQRTEYDYSCWPR